MWKGGWASDRKGAGFPTGKGPLQLDYQRQVATMAAAAAESDFAVSQAELSARQAMLENAADIKVTHSAPQRPIVNPERPIENP